MNSRPSFPIKLKLITVTTILIVSIISFFTKYATNLFEKDKKAYLYENSLFNVTSIAKEFNYTLGKINSDIENLSVIKSSTLLKKAITGSKYIINYRDANNSVFSSDYKEDLNSFTKSIPTQIKSDSIQSFEFNDDNYSIITKRIKKKNYSIIIKSRIFNNLLTQNRVYNSVALMNGSVILGNDTIGLDAFEATSLEGSGVVKKVKHKTQNFLLAIAKTSLYDLSIISTISESSALSVTDFLIKRAIYFAIFILAIATIFVVLFSRSISSPIEKLFNMALKIGQGEFDTRVDIRTRDELGTLGNSFNKMSEDIQGYIEEMKEKARLDEEVKVAKLVQDQFFPDSTIKVKNVCLNSFAAPASECGGDWWGHFEHEKYIITIIADATGHGLPAAFLTSAINSAFNSIKIRLKEGTMEMSTSAIASHLNQVINLSNSQILLTSFISILDTQTLNYEYTNASHLEVLKIPKKEVIEKSDIAPLLEAKGARFGEKPDSLYTSEKTTLNKGDLLVYMTDGITEAENTEKKQFGNRKLLKILMTYNENTSEQIRDRIIEDVNEFRGEEPLNDDLTLICLEVQ